MNWELVGQAKAIFEKLIDSPADDRQALLDQDCPPGSVLRREVEGLLAAYESPRTVFKSSLPELFSGMSTSAPRRLGDYEIIRPLGQGGMAKVYLAKRADGLHNQEVALKVIDRALSTAETEVRVRREVRALSKMAHPNIVRLLDGGITDDGLFYMVMEYVSGTPIEAYCCEHALGEGERLRVFLDLCEAVSYAHRNLIVHRDIKPSNVLVTGSGIPKLLDFGVAKLLDEDSGERFTSGGFNRLTVEYASPEQLRADSTVSTASDVYSLGVVLYEILVGRLPYRFRGSLPHEVVATILEDEPIRPKLSGELTAIVLTALRQEPERRYSSVDYLKDDIERYLAGLPIKAFRDSVWYRFAKLVRRRKEIVSGVVISAAAILIAAGVAIYQGQRAKRRFEDTRLLADTVLAETQSKLWGVRGSLVARVYLQEKGVEFLERLLADSPRDKAINQRLVYALLMQAGTLVDLDGSHAGDTRGAKKALDRAFELAEAQWIRDPKDPTSILFFTQVHYYLGKNLLERGEPKRARAAFERAVQIQEEYYKGSADFESQENLANAMSLLGSQCAVDGERDRALGYHRRALLIREANVRSAKELWLVEKRRQDVSSALYLFAQSQKALGLPTEAMKTIERAIAEEEYLLNVRRDNIVTRYLLARRFLLKAELQLAGHSLVEARKLAERAVTILREVVSDEKGSWGYIRAFGRALGVLAAVCEAQEDRPSAIRHLKEEMALTSAAAAKDPMSAIAQAERDRCKVQLERLTVMGRGPE